MTKNKAQNQADRIRAALDEISPNSEILGFGISDSKRPFICIRNGLSRLAKRYCALPKNASFNNVPVCALDVHGVIVFEEVRAQLC